MTVAFSTLQAKATLKSRNDEVLKKNERPRVSFYDRVRSRRAISLKEYTDAEKDACWYTRKEIGEIRMEANRTVDMMESDGDNYMDEENHCCVRGLEHKIAHGSIVRWERQFQATNAVLVEQSLQRDAHFSDQDMISLAYSKLVDNAKRDAHVMGINDAQFALLYMADSLLKSKNEHA